MARHQEKVIQTRLGERTIEMDKILTFPRGLVGLETSRDFVLLQMRDESPFLILQSLEDPRVGLLVADPYSFLGEYDVKLGEAEQKLLQLDDVEQMVVLVTVTIPPGAPEKTALNLSGPILVNQGARLGLQVPQPDSRYPAKIYLHEQQLAESAE
ncbi:flagellar assembly protein FliW [Megalodesulfovibrio gigas]|nr:flagellar assembly protein FliW [Megalodesulfovibrio gigas]